MSVGSHAPSHVGSMLGRRTAGSPAAAASAGSHQPRPQLVTQLPSAWLSPHDIFGGCHCMSAPLHERPVQSADSPSGEALLRRQEVLALPAGFCEASKAAVGRWFEAECARGTHFARCFSWREGPARGSSVAQLLPCEKAATALADIYTTHCPARLPQIGTLLARYKGREGEIVGKVRRKYLATAASGGAAHERAGLSKLTRLYEGLVNGRVGMIEMLATLDAIPTTTRRLWESGTLRAAYAERRPPEACIDVVRSGDSVAVSSGQAVAAAPYCSVCRRVGGEDGYQLQLCKGCGVAAYCCAEHAAQDEPAHRGWCAALLLSRLLWQCAVAAADYEHLRRRAPQPLACPTTAAALHLPPSWAEYFQLERRSCVDVDAAATAAAAVLAPIDQMLATDSLSSVMSTRYALKLLQLDTRQSLCVWVLGAVFETDQPWIELLAWLPLTTSLTIVLSGPDVVNTAPSIDPSAHLRTKQQRTPASLTVHYVTGLFHWLGTSKLASLPVADLRVAFNSGIPEYTSWPPTLRMLLRPAAPESTVPLVVTAWSTVESLLVRGTLLDMGAQLHPQLPLHENPWSSLVPQRVVDHCGTTSFSNRYIVAFLPRLQSGGAMKRSHESGRSTAHAAASATKPRLGDGGGGVTDLAIRYTQHGDS
jgi:hypothetical protein